MGIPPTFALPAAVDCDVFLLMSVVGLICDVFGARPASVRPAPHVALQGSRLTTHACFRPASGTRHAFNLQLKRRDPRQQGGL